MDQALILFHSPYNYTLMDAPNSGIVFFIHPLPIIICSNAVGCHQAGPEECHGDRCQLQGLWWASRSQHLYVCYNYRRNQDSTFHIMTHASTCILVFCRKCRMMYLLFSSQRSWPFSRGSADGRQCGSGRGFHSSQCSGSGPPDRQCYLRCHWINLHWGYVLIYCTVVGHMTGRPICIGGTNGQTYRCCVYLCCKFTILDVFQVFLEWWPSSWYRETVVP